MIAYIDHLVYIYNCRTNATKSRFDFKKNEGSVINSETAAAESVICNDLMVIYLI